MELKTLSPFDRSTFFFKYNSVCDWMTTYQVCITPAMNDRVKRDPVTAEIILDGLVMHRAPTKPHIRFHFDQ